MQNKLLQQYKEEEETGKSMTQCRNVTFEERKKTITQEMVNEEDLALECNQ